jgi:uncharacterized protein with PIN domain
MGIRLVAVKLLGVLCRHLRVKGVTTMVLNEDIISEVIQLVQNFDKETAHVFL